MPCKGRIFRWRDRRQLHFDFVTKIKVRLKSIQKVFFVVRKKLIVWGLNKRGASIFVRAATRISSCMLN